MTTGFSSRSIHLSSKYATSVDSTNTRYTFQLSQGISIPQEYEMFVSVLSVSIPISWYAVPSQPMTYTKAGVATNWGTYSGSTFSGVLGAGNYAPSDIITAMSGTSGSVDIGMSFSSITGLFTFKNQSASSITIPAYSILGITSPITIAAGASSAAQSLPDIYGTRYVNIVSNLPTNNVTAGVVPKAGGSVLLAVPVNGQQFTMLAYTPNQLLKNRLANTTLNSIEIVLCDSNLAALQLNNSTFEIDLLVECVIPPNLPQTYNSEPNGLSIYALNRDYHGMRKK